MNKAEPYIFEYHLDKWTNPTYRGTDVEKLCHPELKAHYKGLLRYETDPSDTTDEEETPEDNDDDATS